MLTQMRRGASTWLARGLIVFLGISFGAWGIQGIFRFAGDKPIVIAGSAKIHSRDLALEFDREVKRMKRRAGENFDAATARMMGMGNQVLNRMIADALIDQEAERLGIVIPDSVVVDEIHKMPVFQGPGGFDRLTFDTVLRMNDFTEPSFVSSMRHDLLRRQLLSPIIAAPAAPAAIAEPLFRRLMEQRVADYVVLGPASIGPIAPPDPATLEAFYKDNEARFRTPEYRKLSALILDPKQLAKSIDVPESDIAADYESHRDAYNEPEKRSVEQFVLNDPAKAEAAAAKLAAGADFDAVAKEFAGLSKEEVQLGEVTKNELPAGAAEAIFEAKPNVVVGPLKTALGQVFARVTAIKPGASKSLDQVRTEIRDRLALDKAKDQIYEMSRQIEDKRAGGADVASIAKDLHLNVVDIAAVDRNGLDRQGKRVAPLGNDPKILEQIFSTDSGQATDLTEDAAGIDYLIQVDAVTPESVKPLSEVKDQAIAAWTQAEREKRLLARAGDALEELRHGADLAKFGKVVASKPLTRGETTPELGQPAVSQLFAAKAGEPFVSPAPAGAGEILGRVARIIPVDLVAQAANLANAENEVGKAEADDEIDEFVARLKARYGVTINEEGVARALGGTS